MLLCSQWSQTSWASTYWDFWGLASEVKVPNCNLAPPGGSCSLWLINQIVMILVWWFMGTSTIWTIVSGICWRKPSLPPTSDYKMRTLVYFYFQTVTVWKMEVICQSDYIIIRHIAKYHCSFEALCKKSGVIMSLKRAFAKFKALIECKGLS